MLLNRTSYGQNLDIKESEVLSLSNYVVKLTKTELNEIKNYYQDYLLGNPPQGALFTAKYQGCTITAYNSGKVLFQGKNSELEAAKWNQKETVEATGKKTTPFSPPSNILTMSVIGSDEVGTGDYFGPITVTAAYVSKDLIQTLQSLGVKDSKHLSDAQICSIAQKLIQTIPYSLLILHNEKYNELQKKGMTQGKMKALLHNQAINHVQTKIQPTVPEAVLIDQFVDPSIYFKYNEQKYIPFKEHTYFSTKAESIHIAVAAASIISRYAFLKEMEKLSEKAGFPLPKGASNAVDEACAQLIAKHGETILPQFVKLHFANTKKAKAIYEKKYK